MNILVIDDEEEFLKLISLALSSKGFNSILAHTGEEALVKIKEMHDPINLIISDVNLTDINGFDLVEQIRAKKPLQKALFISGSQTIMENFTHNQDINDNFLQKPFSLNALLQKVISAVEKDT